MKIELAEHTLAVIGILSKYYSLSFERQLDIGKYYSEKGKVAFRCTKREEDSYYFSVTFYGLCTGFDAHFYQSRFLGWRLGYVKDKLLNDKSRNLLKNVGFIRRNGEQEFSAFKTTESFIIFLDNLIPLIPPTKGGPIASFPT